MPSRSAAQRAAHLLWCAAVQGCKWLEEASSVLPCQAATQTLGQLSLAFSGIALITLLQQHWHACVLSQQQDQQDHSDSLDRPLGAGLPEELAA